MREKKKELGGQCFQLFRELVVLIVSMRNWIRMSIPLHPCPRRRFARSRAIAWTQARAIIVASRTARVWVGSWRR